MLDGTLHLVGEGLRGALQPPPHVVDERGVEVLHPPPAHQASRPPPLPPIAKPDLRVEHLPLGLILGEVGELDHGGHEVAEADGHEAGEHRVAPVGNHEVGDLRPDVEQEHGPVLAEEGVGEGGAGQRERLDVHALGPEPTGPHRRGVARDHLPLGGDDENPVEVRTLLPGPEHHVVEDGLIERHGDVVLRLEANGTLQDPRAPCAGSPGASLPPSGSRPRA